MIPGIQGGFQEARDKFQEGRRVGQTTQTISST